jgi:hypothetical protein
MPLTFNTIRSANNSNILTISDSAGNLYTIILPDKSYSSILSLLTDINSLLTTTYPSVGITFSMSGGLVQMNFPTTGDWADGASFNDNLLSQTILGFDPVFYNAGTGVLSAIWPPQLNYDLYLNMYLYNFPNSNANNELIPCSYKIPLNAVNGQGVVFYQGENATFLQYVDVPPHTIINQIGIALYDRYGFSINGAGSDYSLTLLLET